MPSPEQPRARGRSAFAAAFLSLLFPGLGQAYAGAYSRALAWAAPPVLLLALAAGIAFRMKQPELLGYLVANLGPIFVVNVVLLVYRAAAIADAWRVVTYLNEYELSGGGRLGRPRIPVRPLPLAGLLAVLLVMAGAHVAVAQYDLKLNSLVSCVFDDSGTANCDGNGPDASGAPGDASAGPTDDGQASGVPTVNPSVGSPLPSVAATPPPDLTKRFNILLIGSDQRPKDTTYNTDTMIVLSIDPQTKQVAMFSLPRDAVDVPVPPGPARSVFGTTYRLKINSWLRNNMGRSDLWPGPASQRGFTALKSILGNLYGLDIRYYVEVNFSGFRQVVDAVGGVSINVQVPVVDDDYPGDDGHKQRIYIPAGFQHMTGAQALIYARSRHGSNDFDRAVHGSSGCSSRSASRAIRRRSCPGWTTSLAPSSRPSIRTSRWASCPSSSISRPASTPTTSARTSSRRRSTAASRRAIRAATSSCRGSTGSAPRWRMPSAPTPPTRRSARRCPRKARASGC
jgi:LCP family protein required for cell wall assembly